MYISLTAPSRVSGVFVTRTVENGTSALRVNWTTPQSDLTISQYEVYYKRNGTTSWNRATPLFGSPPATSTILTGLDAGTEYNIRVRAVSAVGAGNWSVEQTERTFGSEFLPYGRTFWQGIYFGRLVVLSEIRQYFHPPNCSQYDVIITDTLLCDVMNTGPPSFKLRKNGAKIVHIWSTISWFQRGSICCGLKQIQQCLH